MGRIAPEIITDPAEFQRRTEEIRRAGRTIGLVPTMGALHCGHLSLVLASKSECDVTAVSIFVNPTQFAPGEDYEEYPRTLTADLALLEQIEGVDLVFAPKAESLYPRGFAMTIHVGGVTERFEGESRPTHFDGVAVIVLKLFHLAAAHRAYFGEKDFQQVAMIRKMVADLNLPVQIVVCPTIRERDGLAMSSRNRYLSSEERNRALILYEALGQAEFRIHAGERSADVVRNEIRCMIENVPGMSIDYIAVVDPETLVEMTNIAGNVALLLAVRCGAVRLIDSMVITPS